MPHKRKKSGQLSCNRLNIGKEKIQTEDAVLKDILDAIAISFEDHVNGLSNFIRERLNRDDLFLFDGDPPDVFVDPFHTEK